MSEREDMLKTYLKNQAVVYDRLLAKGITFLSEDDIWTILQSELNLEYYEVIHAKLTDEKILEVVLDHINQNGLPLGKIEFDVDENDIDWLPETSDTLEKATLHKNGRIWVVHRSDADPFPSIPHAHNYQENYKLNLYTGELYRKTKLVGKMKKKELAELVEKINSEFPDIKFHN
ncbi:hypothetical protein BDE36_0381 [Arcticibacter tournemirensis]|uniref:Uncharacterized protein n=1 Tax=Arcticibacter tournemirensis TaxID=699437 RepID=A0A5M9HFM3_9SPHI|nr:hypothetical protein [Arcticibacter tournemirensis]KAA8485590.1 hypothetical protein F1649_03665 [Arcticibacter tournemirensis]TQM48692.1 hypothetical protein BDE36_0381 [Arcticibacter tournemirensis]